jgi:3-hydroxybutyrate dehydrogenase
MTLANHNSHSLQGRRALITGSTDGLGLAIAQGLAESGCHVALHGLQDAALMSPVLAHMQTQHGIQASYCRSDLSTRQGIEDLHAQVCATGKAPDILINNAVMRHFGPIETLPFEDWQQALNVNLSAAFGLIQKVLPNMKSQVWGRIIQMTSVYGLRGTAQRVDYVTTKTALIGLTRAVAAETVADGITSNAICPGSVLTPGTDIRVLDMMRERSMSRAEAEIEFLQNKQPTQRFVRAQDVAASVVFLCSPAASEITGHVLPIDGGWSAL